MPKMTNADEYEKLSKEQLIALAKLYGRLALALDGLWFLGVERARGTADAIALDEEVWGQFGTIEARLLKRFLSVGRTDSPEEIATVYLLTPVFGNMGGQAETSEGKCVLSVTECHPQKARIRKGLGEFPCKAVGGAYIRSLLAELNPAVAWRCVVCPPDGHPDDLWCQWEVRMDGGDGN